MPLDSIIFFTLAGLALLGGLLMITARNLVHAVLWMLLTFFNVAAIFVTLGAEFVAVIQVLVYAGAILVLFLFVVMLLNVREQPEVGPLHPIQRVAGWLAGLMLAAELWLVILNFRPSGRGGEYTPERIAALGGNVAALGGDLYTTWLLPFEIASVILLAAAIGAIVLAREEI